MIGWLTCSILGFLLSLIISLVFVLSNFNVTAYAILYSLGQVLNIGGSCFLSTPSGHFKDMTKKTRIIPSVVYILSIILTIVIAVATQIRGLVFLFLVIQVLAYYWYTISFIPFGQKILKNACECCIDSIKSWFVILYLCIHAESFIKYMGNIICKARSLNVIESALQSIHTISIQRDHLHFHHKDSSNPLHLLC